VTDRLVTDFDERCRGYCGCEKCDAHPRRQQNRNWTQPQLDQCRFSQFKAVIEREVRMLTKRTD
jgi:hypothetical protein